MMGVVDTVRLLFAQRMDLSFLAHKRTGDDAGSKGTHSLPGTLNPY